MKSVWIPATVLILVFCVIALKNAFAFDKLYAPTPSGDIEVKDLPARRALSATGEGGYFERDDGLFMTLFDYIKKNDVAMTTPVEAEIQSTTMRFFVGPDLADESLNSTDAVQVSEVPAYTVVSFGLRGRYSDQTFNAGRKALEEWLKTHPEWRALAEPYAVYWDGPYMPVPFRRSEVHVRIAPTSP